MEFMSRNRNLCSPNQRSCFSDDQSSWHQTYVGSGNERTSHNYFTAPKRGHFQIRTSICLVPDFIVGYPLTKVMSVIHAKKIVAYVGLKCLELHDFYCSHE